MYDEIINGRKKIAVVGLGYVGLPIALAFARQVSVVGFDINEERAKMMRKGIDPSCELDKSAFVDSDILFTTNEEDLEKANFYIIAVPTPIDEYKKPDLKPLLSATRTVAKALKKGDYVVYESTVYPGCTEEDCVPLLEEISGLRLNQDFKVGFSPERINPGDREHTLEKIVKVVSGSDEYALKNIAKVYEMVITAGVHKAPSIKVAEAAKIIENTQRDVNIALMNELSMIFEKMNINTHDVLEAANTKWNFLNFFPGLVGGHCIGVDPYYLTFKAKQLGHHPQIIDSGRSINDGMPSRIAEQVLKGMIEAGKTIVGARVLVLGLTFKEDVADIRNTKVVDLIRELESYKMKVKVFDPQADRTEVKKEYDIELLEEMGSDYDSIIAAVKHKDFEDFDEEYFLSITRDNAIFYDIKSAYKNKIKKLKYYSL